MYLYLIENNNTHTFYVGITGNIKRRKEEHNADNVHYTGRVGGEWVIVGYKELTEQIARREEKRLKKSKNKKYIYWYFTNISP